MTEPGETREHVESPPMPAVRGRLRLSGFRGEPEGRERFALLRPSTCGRAVGSVVVVGLLATATTALLTPTASADTTGTPTDLTCAVTTAGLPAHLAWIDVPATLHTGPTGPDLRAAAAATQRGELALRLPDRAGALMSPYVPAARTVPDGLTVTVDITTGTGGGEVVLTTVRDPATTPLPGLVLPPVEFTCRVPASRTTDAWPLGRGSLGDGPGPAGAPGAAPQDYSTADTSGAGDRAAKATTTTPTATASAPGTRAGTAAPAATPPSTTATAGQAHGAPTAPASAESPVDDLAGPHPLAVESPRSLDAASETGVSVPLPAVLWTAGGLILLSLLYALWTSVRPRRVEARTTDRSAGD